MKTAPSAVDSSPAQTPTPPGSPPATPPPVLPTVIKITSLDQIAVLHDEPLTVHVYAYGKIMEVTGRRLQPNEQREVQTILENAIPPRGEDGKYNFDDTVFLEKKAVCQRQARAKCLLLAFPDLFLSDPPPKNLVEMQTLVENRKIMDEVLEALYGAAVNNEVRVLDWAAFISGNSSPTN